MLNFKLRYIATVAPFLVIMAAMTLWMSWDFVEIERVGRDYIYRAKHSIGLIFLPLGGFCIASGAFIARLGRLALVFAGCFILCGIYAAWYGLSLDLSNQHVRVSPDGVHSEWGSQSEPRSVSIDFRTIESLSLVTEGAKGAEHQFLIAVQHNGQALRMPVNDLVRRALKRVFANASAHKIELMFPDIEAAQKAP